MLFMLSMLGLVLADNLIALFVFWELTTITSYLLIGFTHARPEVPPLALQALSGDRHGRAGVSGGLILLGTVAGTFELSRDPRAGRRAARPARSTCRS